MGRRGRDHAWVLAKYLVLQVPGWLGVGALLAAGVRWWELDPRLGAGLFAAWVVKDLALFPVLRRAYEPAEASPAEALVGAHGVVMRALEPAGTVRLGAELWSARVASGEDPLAAGTAVRVRAVRGLTLWVEADPEARGRAPRGEG